MALLSRQPSQAVEAAVTLWGGQRAAQRPPCSDGRPSLGHDSGSVYAPSAPGPCVWWPAACLSAHSLLPWVHSPGLFSPRQPQRRRLAVIWGTAEKLGCVCFCLPVMSITVPSAPRALPTQGALRRLRAARRPGSWASPPASQAASWSPRTEPGPQMLQSS